MDTLLHLAEWFGTVSGLIGICIAIYLQMLTQKRINPSYVFGFYLLGCILILMNTGAYLTGNNTIQWLRLIGVSMLTLGELWAGFWVFKHSDIPNPRKSLFRTFIDDPDDQRGGN